METLTEMRCVDVEDGKTVCLYGSGAKSGQVAQIIERAKGHYRKSLSEPEALRFCREVSARIAGVSGLDRKLDVMRQALRSRVRYLDDPPGLDTIQSLSASLRRGAGDCVSLTIGMSVLCKQLLGKPGIWRLGGSSQDPNQHIWNVVDGVPIDASDPMPRAGEEFSMEQRKEIGVGRLQLSGRQAILAIARSDTTGKNMIAPKPSDTPLELFKPKTYPGFTADASLLLSELYPDEGMFTPLKPGVSGTTEQAWLAAQQQWPENRRAGLTYGELSSILAFLRNYGMPSYTLKEQRNEAYETPLEALRAIMARWESMGLALKSEFAEAYRLHVTMYGWAVSKGLPKANDPVAQQAINWPGEARKMIAHSGSTKAKLRAIGAARWQRYVAAMAISRDLFAEEVEQVGGVQPGLVDTISDARLEGVAVTGQWVNLAGMWRWKGFDIDGVPLNESTPLFPAPLWAPEQAQAAEVYNGKIMRWLLGTPGVRASLDKAAPSGVSRLVEAYNARARFVRGATVKSGMPSPTGMAYGALLAQYFSLIGLDMRTLFGAAWPQVQALIDGKAPPSTPATTGVSGMNAFAKLARQRGISGAADAVAPASTTPTGGGPTGADYLQASVGWAKALTDLGLGIYATQVAKQQAEQDRKLQKSALDQLASQKPAQPVQYAPQAAAEPMISSTVLLLFGVAAAALAFKKR